MPGKKRNSENGASNHEEAPAEKKQYREEDCPWAASLSSDYDNKPLYQLNLDKKWAAQLIRSVFIEISFY